MMNMKISYTAILVLFLSLISIPPKLVESDQPSKPGPPPPFKPQSVFKYPTNTIPYFVIRLVPVLLLAALVYFLLITKCFLHRRSKNNRHN
ncbi:hypothetical protein AAZX31_10G122600 [Glycine max]|nr:hypothetical protein GLYMA_10G128932v4 [Glycine max]KAG5003974.1 hypothetical protein JHK86_028113 [Glycine max]KAH1137995.1 hypothetical protein GYH30_027836 [Glycine max]